MNMTGLMIDDLIVIQILIKHTLMLKRRWQKDLKDEDWALPKNYKSTNNNRSKISNKISFIQI